MVPLGRLPGLLHARPRARVLGHPNLHRHRLHREPVTLRQNRHALDGVLQLARIPRPAVAPKNTKNPTPKPLQPKLIPRPAAVGPENAPFSWPNSSPSSSSVGIAAQFTFTNGPPANGLC